ncbi:MAG TPA: response regulator [Coriobacteriia bacterium]|nr:response regulator [Coriobacteriia bacterium]
MESESKVGVYSINAVAENTGVPASTLRHWEKIYGVIKPTRTDGGHRLYSGEDVERIKWLKHKIDDEGVQAAAAHKLLAREMKKISSVADEAHVRGAVMILVAEKDPITAELEEYFLGQEGYDVHIVLDGLKALKSAETLQPDLIIIDVILPGMSGLKVCSALKNNKKTQHIPVLVFSVLDVRDRALSAGADAFLLKPIEQPKLIGAVKSLLGTPKRGGTREQDQ